MYNQIENRKGKEDIRKVVSIMGEEVIKQLFND